jgi:hypothetical protein
MEGMTTCAPHHRTVISRVLAVGRAAIKRVAADATKIITCVPSPDANCMPPFYLDLERHVVGGASLLQASG